MASPTLGHISLDTFSHIMENIDYKDAKTLRSTCKHIKSLTQYFGSIQNVTTTDTINNKKYIKYVTFDHDYNMSPYNLPNSITHITFEYHFNESVDTLPHSLTHLSLGDSFNQSVDKLPRSLTHLSLGDSFNHNL